MKMEVTPCVGPAPSKVSMPGSFWLYTSFGNLPDACPVFDPLVAGDLKDDLFWKPT